MSTSLEQAYAVVEQAYAAGDYRKAFDTAEALLAQIPSGRNDQLQQRLQLLLGHIHLYGLQQPDQAAAAYRAVLSASQDPGYRASAKDGLQQIDHSGPDQPATPWLEQLSPPAAQGPHDRAAVAVQPAPAPLKPRRQRAPDPYDRGLLQLELSGRPSELDDP